MHKIRACYLFVPCYGRICHSFVGIQTVKKKSFFFSQIPTKLPYQGLEPRKNHA